MSATQPRILVVDDDEDLRAELVDQLSGQGFVVEGATTASEGVLRARAEGVSLVLLDVHLPDEDGRDACRKLREAGVLAPIVLLTGADAEQDIVRGLDSGANDYVTKPFKFSVLLARIRAHLRTHENSEDATFQIGPYRFKPSAKVLIGADERKIRLTEKEANILKYLYRAQGRAISREDLLRDVWGYNAGVTTHTLETHIYRLRQKIEPNSEQPTILLTDAAQGGYRLEP